jgi:heme oxygenase
MSLKELTKDNHIRAEKTAFMQMVINGTLPMDIWKDFVYQKYCIYDILENLADKINLLEGLDDIKRAGYLLEDAREMYNNRLPSANYITVKYIKYLISINNDAKKLMAHVYTWHMGDLFGGQMIKRLIKAPHRGLDFDNADLLKINVRAKLNDTMAEEANIAFNWAIKLMEQYTL